MLLVIALGVLALAVLGVMYAAALWIVTGKASPVARCLAADRIDRIVRRETRDLDRHYTELTQRR
jgi:uncharacterized protein YcfJ